MQYHASSAALSSQISINVNAVPSQGVDEAPATCSIVRHEFLSEGHQRYFQGRPVLGAVRVRVSNLHDLVARAVRKESGEEAAAVEVARRGGLQHQGDRGV